MWTRLCSCQEVDEWYAGKLFFFTVIFVTVLFISVLWRTVFAQFDMYCIKNKRCTKRNVFPSVFLCSCLCWYMMMVYWTQAPSFLWLMVGLKALKATPESFSLVWPPASTVHLSFILLRWGCIFKTYKIIPATLTLWFHSKSIWSVCCC